MPRVSPRKALIALLGRQRREGGATIPPDPGFSYLTPSAFSVVGDGVTSVNLAIHAADSNDTDLANVSTTIAQTIVRADVAFCYISAAGTVEPDTPTVVSIGIYDADGFPSPDVDPTEVVFASTGTGNTLVQPTERTNQIGETYGTFESSVEEVKTLSATIEGVAITDTQDITVGDPPTPPAPGDPFAEMGTTVGTTRSTSGGMTFSTADADVTEQAVPAGRSGYGLRFRFGPDAPGADSNAEQRWNMGQNLTEVWWQYDAFYPSNYVHRNESPSNNKFFRLWGDDYDADNKVGASTWYSGSSTNGALRIDRRITAGGGMSPSGSPTEILDVPLNTWCNIKVYCRFPTVAGDDGEMTIWIDDVVAITWENFTQVYDSTVPYWNQGYFYGAANSGFLEETDIYVYHGRWYNTDPGW